MRSGPLKAELHAKAEFRSERCSAFRWIDAVRLRERALLMITLCVQTPTAPLTTIKNVAPHGMVMASFSEWFWECGRWIADKREVNIE